MTGNNPLMPVQPKVLIELDWGSAHYDQYSQGAVGLCNEI